MGRLSLRDTFLSLQYPNYRLWFFGQMLSMVGTWTQSTAQGYLMFELTQSSTYLGYVGFIGGLPTWIFTLYAGAIADRIPRRTMLVFTQVAMMCLAFILAVLTFTGLVQPWHILLMAFCLGICNAFDAPARQAFVVELVEKDALTNAIALNATMFTSAVVLGPALGGLAYAALGPGWCFTINGISFLAVLGALALMRLAPFVPRPGKAATWTSIKEGLRFAFGHPTVRMLITNLGITSLLSLGMITLIPAWAVKILSGDATTNGWLLSARGLGSLTGALLIASLGNARFRGRLWTVASFVLPLSMLLFSFTDTLLLSLASMAVLGWAFTALNNTTNAMVQTQLPDEIRGRVMGIYIWIFFGAAPLGALLAGYLATALGEPVAVRIGALILLVFSAWTFWRKPEMRALS